MRVEVFDWTVEIEDSRLQVSTDDVHGQVVDYLQGDRRTFDCEVRFPDGLTGDVMRVMLDIPYGETRTYGEVAESVGSSPVAVGQACGRNPVPIVVPCHRIVGADSIGGFSADGGPALKRSLLALESGRDQTRQTNLSEQW